MMKNQDLDRQNQDHGNSGNLSSQDEFLAVDHHNSHEIEVYFSTKLKDMKYHIDQTIPYVINSHTSLNDLSKLLNEILGLEKSTKFAFFINGNSLTTDLYRFLEANSLSSESFLSVEYTIVFDKSETQDIEHLNDWVNSISYCDSLGMVQCFWSDGNSKLYSFKDTKVKEICHLNLSVNEKDVVIVGSLNYISDQSLIIYGGKSNLLKITFLDLSGDTNNAKPYNYVLIGSGHDDAITCLAIDEKKEIFISGDQDSNILIWKYDIPDGILKKCDDTEDDQMKSSKRKFQSTQQIMRPRGNLKDHKLSITDVSMLGDFFTDVMVSSSLDDKVILSNYVLGKALSTWTMRHAALCLSSNNSNTICSGHVDGKVRLFDIRVAPSLETNKAPMLDISTELALLKKYKNHSRAVTSVKWNKFETNIIASVSHDGVVQFMDIRAPSNPFSSFNSSKDLKLLACEWISSRELLSGGNDGQIRKHLLT